MGFTNYFKVDSKKTKAIELERGRSAEKNRATSVTITDNNISLAPPSRPRSTRSISSTRGGIINDTKLLVILSYIYQEQQMLKWIWNYDGSLEGCMVRKDRNSWLFNPPRLEDSAFARAMKALNVQAAMTVNSAILQPFFRSMQTLDIPLSNGLRIQILPGIEDLHRARKYQYAAFIASEGLLVVWDDSKHRLLDRAKTIVNDVVEFSWNKADDMMAERTERITEREVDEEAVIDASSERPIVYYYACLVALTVCLITVLTGLGYINIIVEVMQLKTWASLGLIAMTPVNIFFSLFFCSIIMILIAQIIGPVSHLNKNSKFFSATPPPRLFNQVLPHVTIQCPVYKEGLAGVIAPTIRSIKQSISTYELQGGSANILVNDDAIQFLPEEERQARLNFYEDHSIGWTARPKHGDNGFIRKGKFKKASNMNYGIALSNKVEEKLLQIGRPAGWTQADETIEYERALVQVLEEDGRAWADGNIRIGDYILLIDSDTRTPHDCILDAVSEMEQSPNVAIIQFSSGVMQVAHNYFENGITFFTNIIYTAIRFGVASGDVAPFIGHNAILRWSAVQEVGFKDPDDGVEKYWSEHHVSEDFDMALRLQNWGYIIRFATWAGEGFKEGVSLTVYDELARWEKYAYGCNELVFHPIRKWLWRGPFTPLFRNFLTSNMAVGSKINIIAYIGTYYAIGAAWIFTLANYIGIGLYNGYLDKWYVQSWSIWLSIVVVFNVASNVSLAVHRYRLCQRSFFGALFENFQWLFMFIIFFGGISMHVSQALLCHIFEINMQWGTTAKELEFANFFTEVPKVARKFKYSMIFCISFLVVIVIMARATFIPWSYNIDLFVAIFPMALLCSCHLLLPIALNPGLMTFFW